MCLEVHCPFRKLEATFIGDQLIIYGTPIEQGTVCGHWEERAGAACADTVKLKA